MRKFLSDGDHKAGDIIFIVNKNFFFDYLRSIASASFDHVAMFVSQDRVIEAVPLGGVRVRDYKEFMDQDHRIGRINDQIRVPKMVEYCLKQEGRKYDLLQAICVYFMVLFRIKRSLSPIEIGTAFVCTELIGQSANYAGFKFVDNIDSDRLLPDDIYNSDKVTII